MEVGKATSQTVLSCLALTPPGLLAEELLVKKISVFSVFSFPFLLCGSYCSPVGVATASFDRFSAFFIPPIFLIPYHDNNRHLGYFVFGRGLP